MPTPDEMIAVVDAYVAAFEVGDPDAAAALFAEDATVEDPIGAPAHRGREAVRAFYAQSMATGAKLKLEGPVRIAGDHAAFPFSVHLSLAGRPQRIDVVDIFRFDAAGQVAEMRAFWGPTNMTGF
jgi:steroid delta-isomerase